MNGQERSQAVGIFAAALDVAEFLEPLTSAANVDGATAGAAGQQVAAKLRDLKTRLERVPTFHDVPPDVLAALKEIAQIVRASHTDCPAFGDMALHLARSDLRSIAANGWQALTRSDPKNDEILAWAAEPADKPPTGTFAAARWVAEQQANEIDGPLNDGCYTQQHALAAHLARAVDFCVKLSFTSETLPAADDFVHWVAYLKVHHRRATELWPKVAATWPQSPAVEFSWKSGRSAADVALQFSRMMHTAVEYARVVAFGGADVEKLPRTDERFIRWRDALAEELSAHTKPWPAGWTGREIIQASSSLELKLEHEAGEAAGLVAGDAAGKGESSGDAGADAKPTATHSDDFRSVNWFDVPHSFSANQAACVKTLWENWERGAPEVGGQTILESAGISSERMDVVFRDNPAWGTMIVPGATKGSYRLAEVTNEMPKPAAQKKRKPNRAPK